MGSKTCRYCGNGLTGEGGLGVIIEIVDTIRYQGRLIVTPAGVTLAKPDGEPMPPRPGPKSSVTCAACHATIAWVNAYVDGEVV